MKKFLVPTDFSETSKNAARYTAQMLNGKRGTQIILYYVYDGSTASPDGTLLSDEDDKDREIILQQALHNIKLDLLELTDTDITTVTEKGDSLIENIERYVRHNGIDLVVMGITGATKLEQIFMGSNTLRLVNEGVCPVMIFLQMQLM
ncbi:MAG: universal stress protein [Chitinophagaceae bacterium]|nr:universal stress protein [Chitinophagaceae bacterium]